MVGAFDKDPDAKLDYEIDWTSWLNGDTIDSSAWIVPTGITKESDAHDDTSTTIWLSGGSVGEVYNITNRITTAGGRIEDRTIVFTIEEK